MNDINTHEYDMKSQILRKVVEVNKIATKKTSILTDIDFDVDCFAVHFLAQSDTGSFDDLRLPVGDPAFYYRSLVYTVVQDAFGSNVGLYTGAVCRDNGVDIDELLFQASGQSVLLSCSSKRV